MSGGSSNSSDNFRGMKKDEDGVHGPVLCRCGIVTLCWEAWKDDTLDLGRRFFGCSRFKDPRLYCHFFLWADPPYTERAREVIEEMKMKLRAKDGEVRLIRRSVEAGELSNAKVMSKVEILKKKLEVSESTLAELKDELVATTLCYSDYVVSNEKDLKSLKMYLRLTVATLGMFTGLWFIHLWK